MAVTSNEAKRILAPVPAERAFWVNNGPVLKGIIDLGASAKKLTSQQFSHHVSASKNDFAKWTEEVISDADLAKKIRQAKNKDDLAKAVTARLVQLKKAMH